jgi:hypothetical protein
MWICITPTNTTKDLDVKSDSKLNRGAFEESQTAFINIKNQLNISQIRRGVLSGSSQIEHSRMSDVKLTLTNGKCHIQPVITDSHLKTRVQPTPETSCI